MIKRYYIPSVKGEGYAHIVIDTEVGLFATVSDFGNYSYMWGDEKHTACEFREFLLRMNMKYPDYLCGKLLSDRPDRAVYDEKGTVSNIRLRIRELEDKEKRGREMLLFKQYKFSNEFEFNRWYLETEIGDAHELASFKPSIHAVRFCREVMPRFQKMLRKELEEEGKGVDVSDSIYNALRSSIELDDISPRELQKVRDRILKELKGRE